MPQVARFHLVTVLAHPRDRSPGFSWRLLAGNNRELGRSSVVSASISGALDSMAACSVRCTELDQRYERILTPPGGWLWRLEGPGGQVAHSSRMYAREREAEYSLQSFVACAPSAVVPEPNDRMPKVLATSFLAVPVRALA